MTKGKTTINDRSSSKGQQQVPENIVIHRPSDPASGGADAKSNSSIGNLQQHGTTASTQQTLGTSVVPDLMRVYESLTNTGVKQEEEDNQRTKQPGPYPLVNQALAASSQQQRESYQWTYDTTSIPIPAVPQQEYDAVAEAVPDSTKKPQSAIYSSQPKRDPLKADLRDSAPSISSRTLRKRPSATTSIRDDSTSYASDGSTTRASGGGGAGSNSNNKTRKKAKETDNRWSKRFTWPDELHRDFVSAVFDVGLKHASPATLLEHMPKHEQMTSERVKSHLQKYRLHRAKSKKEFMSSYSKSLQKMRQEGINGIRSLSGGEVAAHLTITNQNEVGGEESSNKGRRRNDTASTANKLGEGQHHMTIEQQSQGNLNASVLSENQQQQTPPPLAANVLHQRQPEQEKLMFPRLTEDEKKSPIGTSMGYLMGLFFSLKQQLMAQRLLQSQGQEETQDGPTFKDVQGITDVYQSFVSGNVPPDQPIVTSVAQPSLVQANDQFEVAPPLPSSSKIPSQLSTATSMAPQPIALATAPPQPATTSVLPTSSSSIARSQLEESTMMKREMQSQMAFQNKMRALKQEELNKCTNARPNSTLATSAETLMSGTIGDARNHSTTIAEPEKTGFLKPFIMTNNAVMEGRTLINEQQQQQQPPQLLEQQRRHHPHETDEDIAEELVDHDHGIGGVDDLWNVDVMDDQLFEFLMNN